ncbi:exodeoxyribonuclease V subunit beta, partial [Kosmotoga sp. DU53]
MSVNRDIFISASAGTGKTYRLVSHYVQIFEEAFRHGEKLDVHNVVAITFTRKASKEMKERVHLRINEKIENNEPGDWKNLRSRLIYAWISTIHSFCERILRESSIFLGIDPGFEILSGVRRVALEAQVVRTYFEQHLDELEPLFDLIGVDKTFELFKKALSGMRVNLRIISPYEEEPLKIGNDGEKILLATRTFHKHFKQLVEHYENEARRNNSLDFDDLLIKTRDLLHNFPQLREKYVRRFKYILIDEFQDTDWLQKTIIDYLHEEERNFLLFVGDAKQSIYRFRGADVTVFNRTKAEFEIKNAHLETLSVNRRSHPDLVEFQNRLFSKIMLQDRSGKYYKSFYDTEVSAIPYEQDSNDSRVRVLVSENSDDSQVVAQYIKNLLSEEITFRNKDGSYSTRKIKPGDIAILLRKFVNVSRYEDALEENGIPYYTVGSKAFYDRPEIAGPLAWLDVIVDPLDDAAFARFLLSPAFGATLEDLFELKSKEKHISDAILKTTDERFKPLRELFIKYSELKHVLSPSSVLQKFVDETEYLPKLASMKRGERAINNVKKMLEIAKE